MVNLTFDTYNFRQLYKKEGESLDKFMTRLRETAKRCNFDSIDLEIKYQIVQKCLSDRLRRKALRDDPLLHNNIKKKPTTGLLHSAPNGSCCMTATVLQLFHPFSQSRHFVLI